MSYAMPSEQEKYMYEPVGPRCIRVLELHPGRKSDHLEGQLLIHSIDDKNDNFAYDALSYMWGDPTPAATIFLSGKLLRITANLTSALQHLRHLDKPLIIWTDALCINQSDISERSSQVQMMRSIYTNAHTVRIWINEPCIDETSPAISALKGFSSIPDESINAPWPDPHFWDPVAPIFTNPYWNRAWIQQEVLNARRISLHCLSTIIPGASVERFQAACITWDNASVALERRSGSASRTSALRNVMASPAARYIANYREGRRIFHVTACLGMSAGLQMTDGRDRLYALMHLAADNKDMPIIVDYNKSEAEIFVELAALHVARHRNVKFLHDSHFHADEQPLEGMPSWMPRNWLGRENVGSACHFLNDGKKRHFDMCEPDAVYLASRRLKLRGFSLDAVRRNLLQDLTFGDLTIAEMWACPLGRHLDCVCGHGVEVLPDEVYTVLSATHHGEDRIAHGVLHSTLTKLHRLSQDPATTNTTLRSLLNPPNALFTPNEITALSALCFLLSSRTVLLTQHNNHLGLAPKGCVVEGDEVWTALGAEIPFVIRPQKSSNYLYICAAYFPVLGETLAGMEGLGDVKVGDVVGEWKVEDVELE
jgi:hypothetical protein